MITWDETFMEIAEVIAKRSKDPDKKVGAVIVKDNIILGVGYNGFPRNRRPDHYEDKRIPTKENEDPIKNKNSYVVHAEVNAILNSSKDVKGATLYCTLFPCHECAKLIVQSGIKNVIYKDPWKQDKDTVRISKNIMDIYGVEYKQIELNPNDIIKRIISDLGFEED